MLAPEMKDRGKKTKTRFLYDTIKQEILSGKMAAGERLPSKRELAGRLGVSVITVENAYAMLEEEGYLVSRERSGFFVRELPMLPAGKSLGGAVRYLPEEPAGEMPPISIVPAMARITRRILSERPEVLAMRPPREGCAVLRNALAEYLRRFRDIPVQPENIVIGSGAEQLYGLTVALFGRGVIYGIEDPSYEKIELVYRSNGAKIERLAMGEDGITDEVLSRSGAKVLHITPYHSYPTGITASARKRYAYLMWAKDRDAYIIEDDFDSEFAYYRKPIEPLYSMDTEGRVIYMNTFTKSLSPAVRIAYMVLPDALMARYTERLGFHSCTVPVLDQYVLAEYLAEGAFERHLGRLRRAAQETDL